MGERRGGGETNPTLQPPLREAAVMEARGFYSEDEEATPAPMVRIGIGFGRGNAVGASALIDTGADVCVFPASLFRFRSGEKGEPIIVEIADATRVSSRILYPSITAGVLRR